MILEAQKSSLRIKMSGGKMVRNPASQEVKTRRVQIFLFMMVV
jgi:hypothetical protein